MRTITFSNCTSLKEALSRIERINFVPLDEIETDEGVFVLSNWKIIIKELDVFLQKGFFMGEKNNYDPSQYHEFLNFVISSDKKNCVFGNEEFLKILLNEFSQTEEKLLKIDCVLVIESAKD